MWKLSSLWKNHQIRSFSHFLPLLNRINQWESAMQQLDNAEFTLRTQTFKEILSQKKSCDSFKSEAFALVREASRRILLERPYDTQIISGLCLYEGKIIELKTGEGKTLSSVAAAYLNALEGKGVHMVTVNDYLAQRDAQWMGPILNLLGLSVAYIHANMSTEDRRLAYQADITYITNNELGFDYLRDNMVYQNEDKVQRGHHYCIIDEIDSILIDESRTPLIISGSAEDDTHKVFLANNLVHFFKECSKDPQSNEYPESPVGDYKKDEKSKHISFTSEGMNKIEDLLIQNHFIQGSLFEEKNFNYVHYFTQALAAHHMYHKEIDYVQVDNQIGIVDEFTGRVLEGRRYADGLHQAIEAKENIPIAKRSRTLATITFQNFFKLYHKISGMTGTAYTEAREFHKIYNLDVVIIPTNAPVCRIDKEDIVYASEEIKLKAIIERIKNVHATGQPILVGTISIENSEKISHRLKKEKIKHEVLNAKNHSREAYIIQEAGAKFSITIATNMAGRGTDIKLGGNLDSRVKQKLNELYPEGTYTPEQHQMVYDDIYQNWIIEYTKVKDLGGLYIIGTERHESRRIDNQLRGRSGRQGDPGYSQFFISLEDSLMRLFAKDRLKRFMGNLLNDEPIEHKFISHSIEVAQKRVEERNFEIRKYLLEYDDIVSKQRTFIYQTRNAILSDTQQKERILQASLYILDNLLEKYIRDGKKNNFHDRLFENFSFEITEEFHSIHKMQDIKKNIEEYINTIISHHIDYLEENRFNILIRMEYLRHIDLYWQRHLTHLHSLIEAVNLRSLAQKNPLTEYQQESTQFFENMLDDIRLAVVRTIFHIQFNIHPDHSQKLRLVNPTSPLADKTKKIGRNMPCPCGSGKKYKYCCM